MAKANKNVAEQNQEGTVRLYHTGPKGGYTDFEKDHAERLLSLEKSMGIENYTTQIDGDSGPNQDKGLMGETEESGRD